MLRWEDLGQPMSASEPLRFFISYSHADKAWAEWIAWQLEAAGQSTVIQAWDFRPGKNFVLEMQRAVMETDCTIAVLSPSYPEAKFPQPEWAAAFSQDPQGKKRKLVPVRVRDCETEGLLEQIVDVDLVGVTDLEQARTKLLGGILEERGKPEREPKFPGCLEEPAFPGQLDSSAKVRERPHEKAVQPVGWTLGWWSKAVVPLLIALVGLTGVLLPNLFGSGGPSPPEDFIVQGRVLNRSTLDPVVGAAVEFAMASGVQVVYTDRLGVFQVEVSGESATETFRLRMTADGFEVFFREMTADLRQGRLSDIFLEPKRTKHPPPPPPPPAWPVTVAEGKEPQRVARLDAMLSVRFLLQEGHQSAVLSLVGPGVNLTQALFGPGAVVPFVAPAGDYQMSLLSWDLGEREVTVVFERINPEP